MKYDVILPCSRTRMMRELLYPQQYQNSAPRPLASKVWRAAKTVVVRFLESIAVVCICAAVLVVGRFIVMALEGNI